MQQPGAISSNRVDLPLTVQDAIRFTLNLDIRYLWVDRLSIVQDDADYKHRQIERMDIVYSHAHMTIVAASGVSANAGLASVQVPVAYQCIRPLLWAAFHSASYAPDQHSRAHFQAHIFERERGPFRSDCSRDDASTSLLSKSFYCNSAFEAEAFGAPEVDFGHKGYRVHEANPLHCLRRTEERYHAGGSDKDFTPLRIAG